MGRLARNAQALPLNYPHLQDLIKRDAESYRDEFFQQYQHFKTSFEILKTRADMVDDRFEPLVTFISHVVPFYPNMAEIKEFPSLLTGLVANENAILAFSSSLRKCLVQSILLLCRKNVIKLEEVLLIFFRLFRIKDKGLRELVYVSIVEEIRRANIPHRNNSLNKSLQNFMFSILSEPRGTGISEGSPEATFALKSLQILIELYRRQIWNDARTVNVVAEACLYKMSHKVMVTALNFFLGRYNGPSKNDDGDNNHDLPSNGQDGEGNRKMVKENYQNLLHSIKVGGGSRAKDAKMKRIRASLRKRNKHANDSNDGDDDAQNVRENEEETRKSGSFSAIHLLNDPQGFVEKLFSQLKRSNDTFETKLLMMNVISRVIGAHGVILLEFYSFLHRYIQPHQRHISKVLAYIAQASHPLIPPDTMQPVLMAIANNFVADHCRSEVIAAGLNGLREICMRCPLSMGASLLQDLAQYKGFKDKSVMMAARSLISLFREKNPALLHRRDRGKEVSIIMQKGQLKDPLEYGQDMIHSTIPGLNSSSIPNAPTSLVKDKGCKYSKEIQAFNDELEEDDDELEEVDLEGEDQLEETEFDEVDSEEDDFDEVDSEEDLEEHSFSSDDCDTDGKYGDKEGNQETVVSESETRELNSEYSLTGLAASNVVQVDSKDFKDEPITTTSDLSKLVTQKLFTPQDFALLRKRKKHDAKLLTKDSMHTEKDADNSESEESELDEIVNPESIEALSKKPKSDYAARMASIKAGREGRLEYGSRRGKETRTSTTNKEKSKRKNMAMMAHKPAVRAKSKRSLIDKQKALLAHKKRKRK